MIKRVGLVVAGIAAVAAMSAPSAVADAGEAAAPGWKGTYEWSPGHAGGMRLDLAQSANRVDIWRANGHANQRWQTYSYGGGLFAFRNRATLKCLWYTGLDNQMTTGPCDDSRSHKFRGTRTNGYWTFKPLADTRQCVDVRGRGTSNGTAVVTHWCNGDSNQRWYSHS
ncbi:RICIN domain-containing protein [Lentzea sp. NBRC 105346]|uniref:RICIN domain-containing protein n=1 Tax=Lentzea sp. NBRC 105346 TaxID=3032205 RepID=UPI0025551CB7|nr:RICIN domain-containing protein [Lentzea sp. NBRC 105346]